MLDRFNRNINYLRISATDRCNLRCLYFMPEEGIRQMRHDEILTYDDITRLTNQAVAMDINKIRITGGEPLVRKGVTTLVKMLASIAAIQAAEDCSRLIPLCHNITLDNAGVTLTIDESGITATGTVKCSGRTGVSADKTKTITDIRLIKEKS